MTFFSHRPQIVVFFLLFSNFPPHHPLFIPKYCEKLSFHPSKILMTFLVIDRKWCYFFCFYFNFPPHHPLFLYFFVIHHCKNSLSSLHIFVHHCTLKQALLMVYARC